jgi:preprotein translocase subunit SecY
MTSFRNTFIAVLKDKTLRNKILFVLVGLIIFRFMASIPIPGVNEAALAQFFNSNSFFGLLNVFSGSGLSTLSIVMLGVGPYITGSIIMQLLTMMIPRLKALYQEEGELGRLRFTQYSRRLTVPLAFLQAYGFLLILSKEGLLMHLTAFSMLTNVVVISAGSVALMWLGEIISEYGIGNGVSLIICAGIISRLPQDVTQLQQILATTPNMLPIFIGFALLALIVVWAVVVVTEAERPIPVTYAKRVRGMKVYGGVSTYLPLRVNQAGVIPIVFGISILLFPQMITNFITAVSHNVTLVSIANAVNAFFNNAYIHSALYFILVFMFTYFYTAVTFDPQNISDNLQKSGAFIPGVRPGESTSLYLARIVTRITFVGALFLGLVAVLPLIVQGATNNTAFAIGGTALLIVVSVVIDLIKRVQGQLSMREY